MKPFGYEAVSRFVSRFALCACLVCAALVAVKLMYSLVTGGSSNVVFVHVSCLLVCVSMALVSVGDLDDASGDGDGDGDGRDPSSGED